MSPVIASVPAGHVYVRHLAPPDGDTTVTRLADPRPRADVPDAQWWPPRMLEPGWVDAHADEFDVMHVHFGFDAVSPDDLSRVASSLRRHGRPLVLTVHDLRNPHHHERELHDAQLGVLVEAADAVLTLTPGAAAEIAGRWGREALVVPHPHVVEEPRLSRPRIPHRGYVFGVHAKSLRAGMDPLPVIEEIVATLPEMPGARLRVDAHTDVMTPGRPRHATDLEPRLRELAAGDRVDLHVHDYFGDDELWDYLQSLDVSVLPYRFGTHSGWLEACHDLGTTVVAPDCGHYADQRPCLLYGAPGSLSDGGAPPLRDALLRAYRERPSWRADPEDRRRERHEVSRAHEQVYAAVLAAAAERGVACAS
ncbi:glycosyltransferase family 1 protein [Terrabacter sp. LjRoot27]|uniref:glycosyltransferase family 1 protein n=1 Tax=Terrabacter sp. LjRoot27 TaxID=3342306 RepID=UPI003ED08BCB